MFQLLEGVGDEFVAVDVRAFCHQRVNAGKLAYSVGSELAGAVTGRNAPWDGGRRGGRR
jgi:hypothetical protein